MCFCKAAKLVADTSFSRLKWSWPELSKKWIVRVRPERSVPRTGNILFSDYFENSCADRIGQTTRLSPNVVPTRFGFPAHLVKGNWAIHMYSYDATELRDIFHFLLWSPLLGSADRSQCSPFIMYVVVLSLLGGFGFLKIKTTKYENAGMCLAAFKKGRVMHCFTWQ